jgi:hypothetical protein
MAKNPYFSFELLRDKYGLRDFSTGIKAYFCWGDLQNMALLRVLHTGFSISILFCHKKSSVSIMFKETQPAPNQVR